LKIVDTTFIISLLRDDPATIEKAEELDNMGGAATTVINIYEAMHGVYRMKTKRRQRLTSLQRVITNLEIFDLTYEAATRAAQISGTLQNEGKQRDPFDCLIAGITLTNGAESIITRNTKHFTRIPQLVVEEH
jgi:predicted nucleic acid-binding protein